jgi:hypothetical protein
VATAAYRRWLGQLTLTSPDGVPLVPTRGAVAVEQARDASELEFVERNPLDLIFKLRCRNGHKTLRTAPQILRALRRTPGSWVELD